MRGSFAPGSSSPEYNVQTTKSFDPSRISILRAAYFNINLRLYRKILCLPWVLFRALKEFYPFH